jgi:nucleoside-diphosphate-sugar epimerase
VGSNEDKNLAELAKLIQSNLSGQVLFKKLTNPSNTISRYVPAIERARIDLGLRINVSLSDAINRTATWNSSH